MNEKSENRLSKLDPNPATGEGASTARHSYEKPAVIYRAPLEAMAAVCDPGGSPAGKAVAGVGGCSVAQS
jgi:hypothetical protein